MLLDLVPSPGFSDEAIRVFLARGLTEVGRPELGDDEEADLTTRWVTLSVAVRMVLAGTIVNAATVAAVLAAHALAGSPAAARPADAPWTDRSTRFAQRYAAIGSAPCAPPRPGSGRLSTRSALAPPEQAVEAFLHHLAVERGSAANTLRSYAADLRRYVEHLDETGRRTSRRSGRPTSPGSSWRCARVSRRSRHLRRPARWPRSAGCTASRRATASSPTTSRVMSPPRRCPPASRAR